MNLVIDIGTTNIIFFDGQRKAVFRNPQYRFGSDIMSRILHAMQKGQKIQTQLLREILVEGFFSFLKDKKIQSLVIVANTVQLHFLLGLDISGMATFPFTPLEFFGRAFSLDAVFGDLAMKIAPLFSEKNTEVFIPACFDAFIGADLLAASLGVGLWQLKEKASHFDANFAETSQLLIDIGTNTELVLRHRGKNLVASTAAGPAFEGGKTKSELKGSELLHALSLMLSQGQMDATGFILVEKPLLCQEDVRVLQLAKAAIRAAVDTLLFEMQIDAEEIDAVFIAGAFGSHIEVKDIEKTGLLDGVLAKKISLRENAVLDGAFLYTKTAIPEADFHALSSLVEKEFSQTTLIQLADNAFFAKRYIEALSF